MEQILILTCLFNLTTKNKMVSNLKLIFINFEKSASFINISYLILFM